MGDTPTLAQIIKDAMESRLAEVHTCMPATIDSYDPDTHLAAVAPSLMRKYVNGDLVELPVIPNVPVMFPRAGGALIDFDLQKGDPVLLFFSERSIDAWITSGGKVDPKDARKHALSDAFAYPGAYPKSEPPSKAKVTASFKADGSFKVKNENGFTHLLADGSFSLETPGMRVTYTDDGKFEFFSNGTDFIAQTLKVIDAIMQSKVATALGLQPLIPDPTYAAERAKLDPFKI